MRIAVTTPTGHVGSAVAHFLLDTYGDVRVKLLCRRPEKVRPLVLRGAEIAVGSQDNADYLIKATEDVDALFWATPPGYGSDNVRAFQNRLGTSAAAAIRANGIPRVVNLSSLGAYLSTGVGPIGGLHDVEGLLSDAAENVTHLRPGFFFENLLWQVESIRNWGGITLPLSGSRLLPMIAARDIGRVAAERLADPAWTGQHEQELHGPEDLSMEDVAEILSDVLDRNIAYVKCSQVQMRQFLLDQALSENAADSLLEMYEAAESGRLKPAQPRSEESTTPTTLAEFAHDVLLPAVSSAVTT